MTSNMKEERTYPHMPSLHDKNVPPAELRLVAEPSA